MKRRTLSVAFFSTAAALSLAVSHASGAALVTYDFETYTANNDAGAAPSTVTLSPAGLTATNLAPNGAGFLARGTTGSVANYFFNSATAPGTPSNGAGRSVGTQSQYTYDTIAGAVTNGAYYSFTLTPTAGGMLSFAAGDNLTFALQVRSLNASGSVPYNVQFYVRTSLDNYAADVGSSTSLGVTTASTNISANESVSLANLGALTSGQAVTFRLYPVDNQQATSNDDFKFDNVVVNGTFAAVPEPGTYAMLGLGMIGLLAVVRRRAAR